MDELTLTHTAILLTLAFIIWAGGKFVGREKSPVDKMCSQCKGHSNYLSGGMCQICAEELGY